MTFTDVSAGNNDWVDIGNQDQVYAAIPRAVGIGGIRRDRERGSHSLHLDTSVGHAEARETIRDQMGTLLGERTQLLGRSLVVRVSLDDHPVVGIVREELAKRAYLRISSR